MADGSSRPAATACWRNFRRPEAPCNARSTVQRALAEGKARGDRNACPTASAFMSGTSIPTARICWERRSTSRRGSKASPIRAAFASRTRSSMRFEPSPDFRIEGIGAQTLKGIREPVKVARIRLGEPDPERRRAARFSLAVLPFQAASRGSALGRGAGRRPDHRALPFQHARGPEPRVELRLSIPLKDPQQVASALGVRFVVTGAVQARARRDCASRRRSSKAPRARVLWAERYDRAAGDVLEVQDELIETDRRDACRPARGDRRRRRRCASAPESLGAFDLLMRGMHHADRLDPASARERDRMLREGARNLAGLSVRHGDARAHAIARLGAPSGQSDLARSRASGRIAR